MPAFPEYVLAFIATTLTVTLAIYAWKHRGVAGALAFPCSLALLSNGQPRSRVNE